MFKAHIHTLSCGLAVYLCLDLLWFGPVSPEAAIGMNQV